MPPPLGNPFVMPVDGNARSVPLLRPTYVGIDHAVTGTSSSATAIGDGASNRIFRITAIGCAVYFVFGKSDVAAASAANGSYLADGDWRDIPVLKNNHYVRAIAVSGTGNLRIEEVI